MRTPKYETEEGYFNQPLYNVDEAEMDTVQEVRTLRRGSKEAWLGPMIFHWRLYAL